MHTLYKDYTVYTIQYYTILYNTLQPNHNNNSDGDVDGGGDDKGNDNNNINIHMHNT